MTLETKRSGGRWWVAAVMLAVAGCSHGARNEDKKGDTRCAESRNLTCLTAVSCTLDRDRGCETCRCAEPNESTDNRRPEAMQPSHPWR